MDRSSETLLPECERECSAKQHMTGYQCIQRKRGTAECHAAKPGQKKVDKLEANISLKEDYFPSLYLVMQALFYWHLTLPLTSPLHQPLAPDFV